MATAANAHRELVSAEPTVSATEVVYRCGEIVPAPGTYWVKHSKHRPTHAAKVRFTVFPECKQCGNKVRFQPVRPEKGLVSEWLRRDPDFRHALVRKHQRSAATEPGKSPLSFPS